jgi:hypothetical protein
MSERWRQSKRDSTEVVGRVGVGVDQSEIQRTGVSASALSGAKIDDGRLCSVWCKDHLFLPTVQMMIVCRIPVASTAELIGERFNGRECRL